MLKRKTSTTVGLLGLEILSESEAAIVFRCGAGTQLDVTKSTTGTADTQTQAAWLVDDVRAEIAELRLRGVKVEEYDMPGLKTEDGIADIGFAWAAWIVDPGKNALGILQIKRVSTANQASDRKTSGGIGGLGQPLRVTRE